MSFEAVGWALRRAPVKGNAQVILIALAERAGGEYPPFEAAFPSHKTLAEEAQVSVATVKRALRDMEERRVIYRGDQSIVELKGYPPHRRPVVWNLNAQAVRSAPQDMGAQNEPGPISGGSNRSNGGSSASGRGVKNEAMGGHSYELQTSQEPPNEPPSLNHDHPSADRFDEFWSAVPRKVGKKKARAEWDKALKEADADTIIDGMRRYRDDPNRVDAFTKHPTTWLSQGCWDDDPLPSRNQQSPSSGSPQRRLSPEEIFLNDMRNQQHQPADQSWLGANDYGQRGIAQ